MIHDSLKLKILTSALVIASCALAAGCGSDLLSVHRVEVQQGNALEPEAVAKLEVGMTPDQVRFLLGNPLINDAYHPNRWDYLYYLDSGDAPVERRRLTVFFDEERVARIERPELQAKRGSE